MLVIYEQFMGADEPDRVVFAAPVDTLYRIEEEEKKVKKLCCFIDGGWRVVYSMPEDRKFQLEVHTG